MALYMVKTVSIEDGETNWFFVSADNVDGVREMVEDRITSITDLMDMPADMAVEIDHEFNGCALLVNP